jgi:hypothetical protein
MNIHYDNGRSAQDGFVYTASKDVLYYELALISAQSLKDYYPNSHITLFTHEKFTDERCKVFDRVITNIPIHARARMWCCARTPYQRTIFNDCDSIVRHRDIRNMHDFLDNCDMFFGSNMVYTVGNLKWAYIDKQRKHFAKLHGSCFGYHKNEKSIDFMTTWYEEYIKQVTTPWTYKDHYQEWQNFDMFTLWRMTSKRFPEFSRFDDLNIITLPRRWNNSGQDLPEDNDGPAVITQIDKQSWSKMPFVWQEIQKRINDETRKVKKRATNDPIIEYN